jgi:hypothetical protein
MVRFHPRPPFLERITMQRIVDGVEEIVRGIIPPKHYKRYKRLIQKYHADLEGNTRLFLEHLGVDRARDLDEPMENIRQRMELLDIHIIHVTVTKQPELNGVWILRGNKPLVAFSSPRLINGRIELKKTILDKSVLTIT